MTIISRNAQGLATALKHLQIEIRFNTRAQRCEVHKGEKGRWRSLNDRNEAAIQELIASSFKTGKKKVPAVFGRDTWHRSLNALLLKRETDPFQAWLQELPAWDGQARIDGWLATCFATKPDCDLTRWASRFLLLGPIWRAFEPGTKLDEMPVLIGPQGCGKSTCLRLLLPPEHPEWFADGLHLAAHAKERAESLLGRVIVEAAEMAGSNRAELESLKSFLSRTDDGAVRLAYRRNPETMLRRCVIAGTANGAVLPNDPTGNRRFVAIQVGPNTVCHECDFEMSVSKPDMICPSCGNNLLGTGRVRQYLNKYRGQLWAEALWIFKEYKATVHLPSALMQTQAAANENFRRADEILEDQISEWLEAAPSCFKLADVACGVRLAAKGHEGNVPMRDQKRIAAVLTAFGYCSGRALVDGKRRTIWQKV